MNPVSTSCGRLTVVGLSVGLHQLCWAQADHASRVITYLGLEKFDHHLHQQKSSPVKLCHMVFSAVGRVPHAPVYVKYGTPRVYTSRVKVPADEAASAVALARLHATIDVALHCRAAWRTSDKADTNTAAAADHHDADSVRVEEVSAASVLRPLGLLLHGKQLTCGHLMRRLVDGADGDHDRPPYELLGWRTSSEVAELLQLRDHSKTAVELMARTCVLAATAPTLPPAPQRASCVVRPPDKQHGGMLAGVVAALAT